jgi:predicted lipid carrier protein YhbT
MTTIQQSISPTTAGQRRQPKFPSLLSRPVALLPSRLHSTAIVKILNTLLQTPLQEGELDFLQGQQVSIEITDMRLRFAVGLSDDKLVAREWKTKDHLNLKGKLHDFLLLATRQEDADTLFFQRRLKMEGSTDLGLEIKNLLDGIDLETIRFHKQIDSTLKRVLGIFERWF